MEEIPELVETLPEDGILKTESIPVIPTTTFSSIPTPTTKKIPITIITGYLGSGKSTLLDIIGKNSNKRLAIILNEFGDSSIIEKSITIQNTDSTAVTEWLDIGNGCLCCTVKDNGVTAIENLIENSRDKIDYILLETTGVADPGPIAKMFWLDEGLASNIYIDGIITVVDSQYIIQCLDDVGGHWHKQHDIDQEEPQGMTTAHLQLAFADVVLLNKIDKVTTDPQVLIDRIKKINQICPIYPTSFGNISLDKILDLHAFEMNDYIQQQLHITSSYHDDRISTISIDFPFFESVEDFNKVEKFLQYILWEESIEIHRLKGLLVLDQDTPDVRVVQGVRDTYEIIPGGVLLPGVSTNKLVFIGKDLNFDDISIELNRFL
ncbi:Uncharacterized protein JA1_005051 [Spathaspora sp. JA1]|nr:Uncharacterized protein JA1_005051 [Spathaspora sp. JA1]